MPCRTIQYESSRDWKPVADWLDQRRATGSDVEETVRNILEEIKENGDETVIKYTRKFDCPDLTVEDLRVPAKAIQAALQEIPEADVEILKEAIHNIRTFHENQKQKSWMTTQEDGTVLGQLVRPIERVGLYVPGGIGGETPLISSLIMNAVPAQVAGVEEICVVSPPRKDGTLNPHILATAALLGLDEIFLTGSAWAIGAMAYGTEQIKPCHMLAGPGNIFVATAKSIVMGEVGIDMFAGPSEIAIIADDSANPAWLAADMLSQAEHDPLAAAILITDSTDVATAVKEELRVQTKALPRNEIAAKSLSDWGGVILVKNMEKAVDICNRLAPEHLELCVDDPWKLIGSIKHAGAIFMGHNTPEPVGDYFAGPNHVLPTLGNARFSSSLSVEDFCKKSSIIFTSEDYVKENAHKIARLARLEGLEAHARSAECRTNKK